MMRWIWIALAVTAFLVAFNTNSPGTLALAIFIGVIGAFGAAFAFAAARIEANSQLQVYVPTPQEAALLRARSERQAAARAKGGKAAAVTLAGGANVSAKHSVGQLRSDPDDGGGAGGDGGSGSD